MKVIHLILALTLIVHRIHGSTDNKILSAIRLKHERIGQCRIQCVEQFTMIPRRRDSDCQRHSDCKSCWQFCEQLTSPKRLICQDQSCDKGCQTSCQYFDQEVKKTDSSETPPIVLSTNFMGCTLYWKTSGNQDAIYVHQLYGMDSQETWFDMGQTMESLHRLLPQQADRAVKLRLVTIAKSSGTVAETEISIQPQHCNNEPRLVNPVLQILPNATERIEHPDHPLTHPSTILIVTSVILLTIFVTLIAFAILIKRANVFSQCHPSGQSSDESSRSSSEDEQNNRHTSNYIADKRPSNSSVINGSTDTIDFYV
jgi:hypothetical protein